MSREKVGLNRATEPFGREELITIIVVPISLFHYLMHRTGYKVNLKIKILKSLKLSCWFENF